MLAGSRMAGHVVTTLRTMKWRTLKILLLLVCAGLVANHLVSRKAKLGLMVAIDSPATLDMEATFNFVGPSTRGVLSQFRGSDYSITVLPFDWVEHDFRVTHTAFIRAEGREVWIRLRLNPFGQSFDIIGYSDRLR